MHSFVRGEMRSNPSRQPLLPVLDLWCSGPFCMEPLPHWCRSPCWQTSLRPCLPKFCGCCGGCYGSCDSASYWLTSGHVEATRTAPCTAQLEGERAIFQPQQHRGRPGAGGVFNEESPFRYSSCLHTVRTQISLLMT